METTIGIIFAQKEKKDPEEIIKKLSQSAKDASYQFSEFGKVANTFIKPYKAPKRNFVNKFNKNRHYK